MTFFEAFARVADHASLEPFNDGSNFYKPVIYFCLLFIIFSCQFKLEKIKFSMLNLKMQFTL